jgi:hypothetical protein
LFATPDPQVSLGAAQFRREIISQVNHFVEKEVINNDTYIPLPILHACVAESLLTATAPEPSNPFITPEVEEIGLRYRLWEVVIKQIEPSLIEDNFYVERLPKELLVESQANQPSNKYKYKVYAKQFPILNTTGRHHAKYILRENALRAGIIARAPKDPNRPRPVALTQNFFHRPAKIAAPQRGTALECFKDVRNSYISISPISKQTTNFDLPISRVQESGMFFMLEARL